MKNDVPDLIKSLINEDQYTEKQLRRKARKLWLKAESDDIQNFYKRQRIFIEKDFYNFFDNHSFYNEEFIHMLNVYVSNVWVCEQLIEAAKNKDYIKIAALQRLGRKLEEIESNIQKVYLLWTLKNL